MSFKNFMQIIILSFYSRDLYNAVASKWRHWGAKFLLSFSLSASIIITISAYLFFSNIEANEFSSLLNGFPELILKEGKAELKQDNVKLPFIIKSSSGQELLVVDLDDINKYSPEAVVFSKDKIKITESTFVLYSSVFSDKIDQDSITNLLQKYKTKLLEIILILGIPLGSLIFFCITFIKSIFFAAIATFISKVFRYKLNFQQLTRIAVVANAPAFFINLLLVPLFFIIGLADVGLFIFNNLYLFYFTYAFIICAKTMQN